MLVLVDLRPEGPWLVLEPPPVDHCISLATEVLFPFQHVILYAFTYQMSKRS